MLDEIHDMLQAKLAKLATFGGSFAALIGGASAETISMIGGLIVGFAGLVMNWHYQRRRIRIMEQAAKLNPKCAVCPEREDS